MIATFLAFNADVAEPPRNSLIAVARARGPSAEHLSYNGAHVVAACLHATSPPLNRSFSPVHTTSRAGLSIDSSVETLYGHEIADLLAH